jgi:tRNA(fMet)-specific endonuclease VapC
LTPRYLLDTNVVSEPLRPKPDSIVLKRLVQYQASCFTAAVVWHELWYGCTQLPASLRRERIENYLLQMVQPLFPILPYDSEAATWHAGERARLKALGLTSLFADGQIAAIAVVNGLILVTRNLADYRHFAGLQIENWWTSRDG